MAFHDYKGENACRKLPSQSKIDLNDPLWILAYLLHMGRCMVFGMGGFRGYSSWSLYVICCFEGRTPQR